jgi:short-subunit dehydrogenase
MNNHLHALVTGASAGIGEAYVRQLASRCDTIVVVARREERLRELAAELAGQCRIEILVADLGTVEGQARVVEAIRQGPALDLLINNAGFSTLGAFATSVLDDEIAMLRLHHEATLALTRAALPAMLEAGRGAVINVASIGGLVGMPNVAVYGASKAFLVSFSRSLRQELAGTGVQVQCLCPGYTRTEIHSRDSFKGFDIERIPEALWMDAETVVDESLTALDASGDPWLLVPGAHNRKVVLAAMDELQAAIRAVEA